MTDAKAVLKGPFFSSGSYAVTRKKQLFGILFFTTPPDVACRQLNQPNPSPPRTSTPAARQATAAVEARQRAKELAKLAKSVDAAIVAAVAGQ